MKTVSPRLCVLLLLAFCFCLSTWLQPRYLAWSGSRAHADNLLSVVMGDSRHLFANHFFLKGDVYMHSGYYPSIFDGKKLHENGHAMGSSADPEDHSTHKHDAQGRCIHDDEDDDFLGKPKDWIDAFSRHFYLTEHTHLDPGKQREILPWLKMSAELDPHQIDTYTVAAYWLRTTVGKPKEAEEFLRDGLRNNPDSAEILFELGAVYEENYQDRSHARNLWELAHRKWMQVEAKKDEPNMMLLEQVVARLARLEEAERNYPAALKYFEQLKQISPNPAAIQKQIDEIKARLGASSAAP
ncbi:MAG: hypothetical protein AB1705_03210 [Verrucomicrobiota bacterium]